MSRNFERQEMFLNVQYYFLRSPVHSVRNRGSVCHSGKCRRRLFATVYSYILRNLKHAKPARQLQQFASKSGGEFVGFEARFDARTGNALEVPDRFVPQEYRDWNVPVNGLEENYSEAIDDTLLFGKRQLIDVKVGCQEDAVSADANTFSIDLGKTDENTAFPSGCLSARLPSLSSSERVLFSLIFRDSRERRRVQVEFSACPKDAEYPFGKEVIVRREMYDQPYNGGVQLIGCGGKVESFVSFERNLDAPGNPRVNISALERDISVNAIQGYQANLNQNFGEVHYLALPANISVRRYKIADQNVIVYEAAAMICDLGAGPGPALALTRSYDATTEKYLGSELFIEFFGK